MQTLNTSNSDNRYYRNFVITRGIKKMLDKNDLKEICTAANNLNDEIRGINIDHEIENEYTRILEQTKSVLNATVNVIMAVVDEQNSDLQYTKFKATPRQQLAKIKEEYNELKKTVAEYEVVDDIEANREIKKHMGEECCDIIVACKTFLKQNYTDKQIQILYDLVNYKNKKRGYLRE